MLQRQPQRQVSSGIRLVELDGPAPRLEQARLGFLCCGVITEQDLDVVRKGQGRVGLTVAGSSSIAFMYSWRALAAFSAVRSSDRSDNPRCT